MWKRLNIPDPILGRGVHMDKKLIIALAVTAIVIVAVVSAAILLIPKSEGGTVKYVTLAPKDMKAALSTGQVDAYIAWEPYVSDSVVGGVGEVMMWSGSIMPNHPCCVVAVRNAFLDGSNGAELTTRFVRAHIDATNWMLDALDHKDGANYTLLVNMAVQFTSRNSTVVEAAFEHIKYGYQMGSNFRSALEEFTNMYIETNMTTNEKLTSRGYASVSDFVAKYANGSVLDAAASVVPSDIVLNPTSPIKLGYLLGDLHQMAQVVAQNLTVGGTKSLFEKYGVNVATATGAPFANGGAEMTGFAAGSVDIGYLGAPPAILQHLNAGIGTTILAQANSEGSGLVVKAGSGMTDLKDLVNKTVATPGESSIQFLLLKIALEKEGLKLEIKT
jgi:NitT/TauT family transport system substrate-binding protein